MNNKYQTLKDIDGLKPGHYINCEGFSLDQWKEALDLFKAKGAPVRDELYMISFLENLRLLGWNEKLETVTGGLTPYWFGRVPIELYG